MSKTHTNKLTKAIIDYIILNGGFAFRVNTTGIYDPVNKKFRTSQSKGISDIIAVFKGRYIGIEIKTGKDKLNDNQIIHRENVMQSDGIYIVANQLNDVIALIQTLKKEG